MAAVDVAPLAGEEPQRQESRLSQMTKQAINYGTEFSAGLTVSFVAMSLGAAFGVQSKRGPLPGILSAGVIALITALMGGTKVQCSGPTAPMTAVTMVLTTAVMEEGAIDGFCDGDEICQGKFINLVLVLTGLMLILAGAIRLGKIITYVPKVVISGFMNGIAVSIWWGELAKIYGLKAGKEPTGGGMGLNTVIMLCTTAIIFGLPILIGKTGMPILKKIFPGTLVAIVFMTAVSLATGVQRVEVGDPLNSFSAVSDLFVKNFPSDWRGGLIMKAIPFAANLTLLCYLDTLLTSLVMDQKVDEKFSVADRWTKTAQNQELMAQGLANGVVSLFGGIPGAQATIRSVLILNEGARTRVAGMMVGVFAIIELVALQGLVGKIPAAVFSGVLLKVGYDVFDYAPIAAFVKHTVLRQSHPGGDVPVVSMLDMLFVLGTTLVTIFVNLNIAVVSFTVAFYLCLVVKIPVPDMPLQEEGKDLEEAVVA
jgi:SulP family sulfate permease